MFALLKSRRRALCNQLRFMLSNRWEFFKIIALACFVALLMGCLRWGFYRALMYLNSVPAIGVLMVQKILEIVFLSTFSLVALSSMVTSLSTHFAASDLSLLLSFPIPRLKIYFWKAVESCFHASWMVSLVLIPFLWVYADIKKLDMGFLFLAFLLFIPLCMSASSIGIGISTLFVAAFPRRRLLEFLSVLGVLVFVIAYSGLRLALPSKLANPDQMEEVLEYVLYLQSPVAPLLPSHWYVRCLNAYTAGRQEEILMAALIMLAFAVAGIIFLALIGTVMLTPRKWALVLEGTGGGTRLDESSLKASAEPGEEGRNLDSKRSLWGLLMLKEIRFFFRDSQRFSNASFIIAVCVIYLVSIYRLPMDTPYLKSFLSFINLALGLFIIAALSLRFCFPQPSIEMAYGWIMRASPLSPSDFLGSKFAFNLAFLTVLGGIMVILSPMFLGTDLRLIPIYLTAAFFTSNVLAASALAIGSAFPKPQYENIIQIETSFGGFLYAVFSLGFVAVSLSVFSWPIRFFFQTAYLNKPLLYWDWVWMGILGGCYLLLSAALVAGSWVWAKRSWSKVG